MIEYGGSPADWIAKDGLPAKCLGDPLERRSVGGLPSYESESAELVVYEFAVAMQQGFGTMMLFPSWYWSALMIAPEGMVPLYHGEKAWWNWRPCLYRRSTEQTWAGFGSQRELEWRHSMWLMEEAYLANDLEKLAMLCFEHPMDAANAKADKLLRDNLGPTQLAELVTLDSFRVTGGETGRTYRVVPGDGFSWVDRVSNDPIVIYCLHPEGWIPEADVALALKLNLEEPELEMKTIEGANARDMPKCLPECDPERRWALRYAADMERELVAA